MKAAHADAKWFQTAPEEEGRITKVMNQYPKLSLVISEFGELSDDFSKLLHVLALFRAKEFNASDAQFLDDKEAYGACIWDFRRRLALESGKRICSIIKAGRKWISGNRPEK